MVRLQLREELRPLALAHYFRLEVEQVAQAMSMLSAVQAARFPVQAHQYGRKRVVPEMEEAAHFLLITLALVVMEGRAVMLLPILGAVEAVGHLVLVKLCRLV